jgi:hypothetical protein
LLVKLEHSRPRGKWLRFLMLRAFYGIFWPKEIE